VATAFLAGHTVPTGTYQRLDSGRAVRLDRQDALPASTTLPQVQTLYCKDSAASGIIVVEAEHEIGPEGVPLWVAGVADLEDALGQMLDLVTALKEKVYWEASFMDAQTAQMLKDAPVAARAALRKSQAAR